MRYANSTVAAIRRKWQFGFKIWAIAQDLDLHVDDVVDVLVSEGFLNMQGLEWRLAQPGVGYRKPERVK